MYPRCHATSNGRYLMEYGEEVFRKQSKIALPQGFFVNATITIQGRVHPKPDRFEINLVCGHNNDIAFHFNPRYDEEVIVRNTLRGEFWDGYEERDGGLVIKKGSTFVLSIACFPNQLKICVNGLIFALYEHRLPPDTITHFEYGGDVTITNVLYDYDSNAKSHSISNGLNLMEYSAQAGFQNQCKFALPQGFPTNATITIHGTVPALKPNRFHINLICAHNNDIALHFDVRYDQRIIVRNTLSDGVWDSHEERDGGLVIKEGSSFTISITCLPNEFKIWVNGLTYALYQHRLPADKITHVEYDGDVKIFSILYDCGKVIPLTVPNPIPNQIPNPNSMGFRFF